jgi:hypothetical protein
MYRSSAQGTGMQAQRDEKYPRRVLVIARRVSATAFMRSEEALSEPERVQPALPASAPSALAPSSLSSSQVGLCCQLAASSWRRWCPAGVALTSPS